MFGKKYTAVVHVEGMMCEHCAAHVEKALLDLPGCKKVVVALKDQKATVTGTQEIEEAACKKAIEEAGYKFISLEK